MASAAQIDFAILMPQVAPLLCDKLNKAMSKGTRLRFGTHGSMEIDVAAGWFFDHESKAKGGVLDLIQHKRGCDMYGALTWLEEQGLKEKSEADNGSRVPTFYDYADQDGVIAYRVERRGKDRVPPFLQHGPDGRGGFRTGQGCMQGVARIPYRLPQLLAADPADMVFVCEGEKDADNLAARGLIATTNSGGAGKFGADLAPYFEGRRVVILPDNDQPGRDHAADVADKLAGHAAALAIFELPGLPDKGDVTDWLALGGSAHQLVTQFAEPALAKEAAPATLPIADLSLWSQIRATPTPFFMAGLIPANEVTLLTGIGGVNKSTFGQQLATCSAAGRSMLGVEIQGGPALYVTAEDNDNRMHWVQQHVCAALDCDMRSLVGKLFLSSIRGRLNNELATFDHDGRLQVRETYHLVRATLEATRPKLVVLDNVGHMFAGNENDRQQVTAFINLLAGACRDFDTTVLLIAHPNKDFLKGNKEGNATSGSTAWLNAVRSQLLIERPEGNEDPDARVLTLGKANYARQGEQVAFRWHDFALVRPEDLPPSVSADLAKTIAATAGNTAFLRCLELRNEQRRHVSEKPTASNYAPRQFEGMPEAKGLNRKKLELAMDRLFRIGAIERGFLYRDSAEGKDIHGLRAVPESSPETSRKVLPESSGDPQGSTGNTVSYTYGNNGAAPSGPPAPDSPKTSILFPRVGNVESDVDLSVVMFPADEVDAVRQAMASPLPDHLRDPFAPGEDE